MSTHKYGIGQRAIYHPAHSGRRTTEPTEFEIVRRLPTDGADPLYRVKAVGGFEERVVKEGELSPR